MKTLFNWIIVSILFLSTMAFADTQSEGISKSKQFFSDFNTTLNKYSGDSNPLSIFIDNEVLKAEQLLEGTAVPAFESFDEFMQITSNSFEMFTETAGISTSIEENVSIGGKLYHLTLSESDEQSTTILGTTYYYPRSLEYSLVENGTSNTFSGNIQFTNSQIAYSLSSGLDLNIELSLNGMLPHETNSSAKQQISGTVSLVNVQKDVQLTGNISVSTLDDQNQTLSNIAFNNIQGTINNIADYLTVNSSDINTTGIENDTTVHVEFNDFNISATLDNNYSIVGSVNIPSYHKEDNETEDNNGYIPSSIVANLRASNSADSYADIVLNSNYDLTTDEYNTSLQASINNFGETNSTFKIYSLPEENETFMLDFELDNIAFNAKLRETDSGAVDINLTTTEGVNLVFSVNEGVVIGSPYYSGLDLGDIEVYNGYLRVLYTDGTYSNENNEYGLSTDTPYPFDESKANSPTLYYTYYGWNGKILERIDKSESNTTISTKMAAPYTATWEELDVSSIHKVDGSWYIDRGVLTFKANNSPVYNKFISKEQNGDKVKFMTYSDGHYYSNCSSTSSSSSSSSTPTQITCDYLFGGYFSYDGMLSTNLISSPAFTDQEFTQFGYEQFSLSGNIIYKENNITVNDGNISIKINGKDVLISNGSYSDNVWLKPYSSFDSWRGKDYYSLSYDIDIYKDGNFVNVYYPISSYEETDTFIRNTTELTGVKIYLHKFDLDVQLKLNLNNQNITDLSPYNFKIEDMYGERDISVSQDGNLSTSIFTKVSWLDDNRTMEGYSYNLKGYDQNGKKLFFYNECTYVSDTLCLPTTQGPINIYLNSYNLNFDYQNSDGKDLSNIYVRINHIEENIYNLTQNIQFSVDSLFNIEVFEDKDNDGYADWTCTENGCLGNFILFDSNDFNTSATDINLILDLSRFSGSGSSNSGGDSNDSSSDNNNTGSDDSNNTSSDNNNTGSGDSNNTANSTSELVLTPDNAFNGYMYLTNEQSNSIYKVDANGTLVSTIANGLNGVSGLIKDIDNNKFYISDDDNKIYQIDVNGTVTELNIDSSYLSNPNALAYNNGYLYIANAGSSIVRVNLSDLSAHTLVTGLDIPQGLRVNSNYLYFTDNYQALYRVDKDSNTTETNPSTLRVADLSSHMSSTDGGLAIDSYGNIYVSDYAGGKILQVNGSDWSVKTVFDIPGTNPRGIHYLGGSSVTHTLFATIFNEAKVIRIELDPNIAEDANVTLFSTLSGNGNEGPFGIIVDNIDLPILSNTVDSNNSGSENNSSSYDPSTFSKYGFNWQNKKHNGGDYRYQVSGNYIELDSNNTSIIHMYTAKNSGDSSRTQIGTHLSSDTTRVAAQVNLKEAGTNRNEVRLSLYANTTLANLIFLDNSSEQNVTMNNSAVDATFTIGVRANGIYAAAYVWDGTTEAELLWNKFISYSSNDLLDDWVEVSISKNSSGVVFEAENSSNQNLGSYTFNSSVISILDNFSTGILRTRIKDSNNDANDNVYAQVRMVEAFSDTNSSGGDTNNSSGDSNGSSDHSLRYIKIDSNGTLLSGSVDSDGNIKYDEEETYSISNGVVTIVDGNKTETIKYNDSETQTDSNNNTLIVHKICIDEGEGKSPEQVVLLEGLQDFDKDSIDSSNFHKELTNEEFNACSGDMSTLYGKDLYTLDQNNNQGGGSDDEYQNNFPYQVKGIVTLSASNGIEHMQINAEPIDSNNWNSTNINTNDGNNSYTLGMESGKYVLRAKLSKTDAYEEYIYDSNSSSWIPREQVKDTPDLSEMTPNGKTNNQCHNDGNFWWQAEDANGSEGNCYNEHPHKWIPNVGSIDTHDFNSSSQMGVNFDLAALYGDLFTLTGSVTVSNSFNPIEYCSNGNSQVLEICEWRDSGVSGYNNWKGANRIGIEIANASTGQKIGDYSVEGSATDNGNGSKTYTFSALMPAEGNYTIRVNKELFDPNTSSKTTEGYFFNPETGKLVTESKVTWMDATSTSGSNTYQIPDTNTTGKIEIVEGSDGSKSVSFGEIDFVTFENSILRLNGSVSFNNADFVQIQVLDLSSGNWFGWKEVRTNGGTFSIEGIEAGGEYILRVSKVNVVDDVWNWESYFYNGSTFVIDENIQWVDNGNGNHIPNSNQTGTISIASNATQNDISNINIDFADLANQFFTISGQVTMPSSFTPGEVRDSNGNWLGWNNVNFDIVNSSNGEYVKWAEIDRGSESTDSSGNKVYDYSIRLASAGDYIVKVSIETYNDGVSKYDGYFISDDKNLTSEINVKQVPVLDGMVANGKSKQQCWDSNNFWWQEEGSSSGNCYDNHPNKWIADTKDTGTVVLSDGERSKTFNIDTVSLENDVYKLTGEIVVPSGFMPSNDWNNLALIRVEASNADTGAWLGDGQLSNTPVSGTSDTYSYSIKLPIAVKGTNVIVKLIKEEKDGDNWTRDSYYINFGSDHAVSGTAEATDKLVAENTVEWTNGIPNSDQTGYLTLDDNKTITLDINYDVLVSNYNNNKLSISGTIILAESVTLGNSGSHENTIRIDAIDKLNGLWVGSAEVDYNSTSSDRFTYDLEFKKSGTYIIKVVMNIDGLREEFFVNFGSDHGPSGDDKLITWDKVHWERAEQAVNGNVFMLPNPDATGYIELSAKVENYEIDFNAFENSISKISGSIIVADDYTLGSKFSSTGTWIGYDNIRVEAISKSTGERIASTQVSGNKVAGAYTYVLKLGDSSEVGTDFVIQIIKESSTNGNWEHEEYYVNFGSNHEYDSDDSIISGKRVLWVEAEASVAGQSWKNYMPNPDTTGYITIGSINPEGVNVDFTTLGQNDIILSGTVTFKSDFNISAETNGARIAIIDQSTGHWVADAPVENNGTYEVNIGDVEGNYTVQVNYWYYNASDTSSNWRKNKFLDFGSDNALGGGDDQVLGDNEVSWRKVEVSGQEWSNWIPDINPITVSVSVSSIDIDLSAVSGGTISGTISGLPSSVSNAYVGIVNPLTYSNTWVDLEEQSDGNYTFSAEELKADVNYSVEFGYYTNGKYYNYFIKDDNNNTSDGVGTIESGEVRWTKLSTDDNGNEIWGPNSEDTTYVSVSNGETLDLNISKTVVNYNTVTTTLSGVTDGEKLEVNFYIPSKPFGRWSETTVSGSSAAFTFEDVKDGNEYILSFRYDNTDYTYDGSTSSLVKNAEWIAYDSNDNLICGGSAGWDCDWNSSYTWNWKPNVTALTISGDANISTSLPEENTVSGSLNLGSQYSGKKVHLTVFQPSGTNYNWANFTLDSNGESNISMKVEDGNAYRIELWVEGLGSYVYTTSATWINNSNSRDTTTWQPKNETLIDINANIDLNGINLVGDKRTITIVLENLKQENGVNSESVWLSLNNDALGYFGEGNENWDSTPVTYDSNISIIVPDGDYNLSVSTSHHGGGFVNDGDNTGGEALETFTALSWEESKRDIVSVNGQDVTITITLADLASFGTISGTVDCDGDSNSSTGDCSGWIEASSSASGAGVVVTSNGSYEINGLSAGTYELNYNSWNLDPAVFIIDENVSVVANTITTANLTPPTGADVLDINGTVDASNLSDMRIVLIKTDGNSFEIIDETEVNSTDGSFSFGEKPKPTSGKAYYVAVSKRVINQTTFAMTTSFDKITKVSDSDNVGLSAITLPSAEIATGITLNN